MKQELLVNESSSERALIAFSRMLFVQPLIRGGASVLTLYMSHGDQSPRDASIPPQFSMPRIDSISHVASTRWLKLQTLSYTDQDGKQREWDIVSRTTKQSPDKADAVVIIPLLRKANSDVVETLLVEQYRPPVGRIAVSFPAGLIDEGESPQDAALRELAEETGYVGEKCTVSPEVCMAPGISDSSAHCVLVEVNLDLPCNQSPKANLDDGEFITLKRIDLREGLRKAVEDSEAMPHIGIYLFAMGLELGTSFAS